MTERRPKYEDSESLPGATGPLAGNSPLRRPGGPQYRPVPAKATRQAAPRPKYEKPNYVIPKRVKVGPVEINLTDASDLQRLGSQGFLQGQMPRAIGAIGTVMGIPDAIEQRSFDPIAEAYRQNRQAEIDATGQARARAGLLGTAVEIGGSLVSGGGIANQGRKALANAPRVASEARKVVQAVAPRAGPVTGKLARFSGRTAIAASGGATAGAIYGSGEGRGLEGAAYGAAGGALGEPVARTVGVGYRAVRRALGRPTVRAEVTAARQMANKIRPDAEQVIAESQRLGLDPPALIDVMTNAGKRRVRAVSSADDAAQEIALAYREATRQGAQDRGQNIVRRMTGQDVDLAALRQQGDAALQEIDRANYGALEPVRVAVDPALMQDLGTNQAAFGVKRSSKAANTDRRYTDEKALDRIAAALRQGRNYDAFGQNVSLQGLEDVYRIMRDRARGMMAAEGPQAVQRKEGYSLSREAERLGQSLADRFPEISAARLASEQARRNIEAIDLGFNAFSPNRVPSELAADIGQLPARRNVLAGAQARLQQQLGENPVNAINSMAYRPSMSARLEAMGAPAQDITQAAQYEISRLRNADFISPNTGSQTTPRLQDAAELSGAIPVTPQGIFTKMLDFAYRRASSFTPDEMVAIVRMGVEPADLQQLQALAARDPDKVPAAIQALIGTQLGIQSGNQSNVAGRSQTRQ